MKKLTQKLVLSVITMALVVVALGTSTFAWFTLTNSASISAFQAQVTAGKGIEISLGQGTTTQTVNYSTETQWYTAVPAPIIQTFIDAKYPSFRFDNVTSELGTSFEDQSGTPVSSGYIEFKLFFRSRTQGLHIAWNSVTLGGEEDTWIIDSPAFVHENGQTYGLGGLGSMKVAAWPAARVSVTGNSTVVYQAPAKTSEEYTADVFNSVATPTVSYGRIEDTNNVGSYISGPAAFNAAAFEKAKGFKRNLTDMPELPTPLTSLSSTTSILTLSTSLLNTSEYYGGEVTVRVWIEGWDADTYDAIFETMLTVSLGFTEYKEPIVTP